MIRLSPAFNRGFGKGWLVAGFAFLYLPIVALVLYSFNDSPVANLWRGFTLKWYWALLDDTEMLTGFWLSLKIAFFTACASLVLGTLAAFALVKWKRFRGRTVVADAGRIELDSGEEAGMWLTATNKSYDFAFTKEAHGVPGRFHHVTFALDSREAILQAADVFLEKEVIVQTHEEVERQMKKENTYLLWRRIVKEEQLLLRNL